METKLPNLVFERRSIFDRVVTRLRSIQDSFHGRILFSIFIAIGLAFISSVAALHYLRNLHHEFIDYSQQHLQAVMLMEALGKITDKESVELENAIALTESAGIKSMEDVGSLNNLQASFIRERQQLLARDINPAGREQIEQLTLSREELHRIAQRCINLAAQGFPESAVFIWQQSSVHWIDAIRQNVDAFNAMQQNNIMNELVDADTQGNLALAWLIVLVLLAFVVSAMIGVSISHQLVKPVKQLIAAAQRTSGEPVDVHFRLPENTQMAHLFKTLAEQIHTAVEKSKQDGANLERQKVARDLHDDLAQTLFAANLMAKNARLLMNADTNKSTICLVELEALTKEALATMRGLLYRVREQDIENTELDVLIAGLCDIHTLRTNLKINYQREKLALQPTQVQVAFFRIAQEALNNIAKHAQATSVDVKIYLRNLELHLYIEDDGIGCNPYSVELQKHGVNIMHERAQSLGATLDIDSASQRGTRVHLVYRLEAGVIPDNCYREAV